MDAPMVLLFYIKPSSNSSVIRSITLKEYFSKLTSNVEVLYPTQVNNGLLLCKSKRTEEKIFNMRHILSNGSTIHLSQLSRPLFQQTKCLIDGQTMRLNGISTSFQQCLPFLNASGGKIQVNPDDSVLLEGHILVLNSIHSYIINKSTKEQDQSNTTNTFEPLDFRSGNLSVKVMSGKLLEQNVEGIIIPMDDKYKLHKVFDQQIQSFGGKNFSNYFKELSAKGKRTHEGETMLFPNRELKIPAKVFIIFTVPRLPNNEGGKDKSQIDSYQPIYEQMIYRALQIIDQNSITNLAMPILEPNIKSSSEKRSATEMAARAMINSIQQFSQNTSIKLKRILIVDHHTQIKRMSKHMTKFQNQLQRKDSINNNIDLNRVKEQSNVPKLPENISTASDSDDDNEPEEYQLPYVDRPKA